MEFYLDNRLPPVELYQKTLAELPAGIVVSIEGIQYLKGDNCILLIDIAGHFQTISENLSRYVSKKKPRIIHGFLRQTI